MYQEHNTIVLIFITKWIFLLKKIMTKIMVTNLLSWSLREIFPGLLSPIELMAVTEYTTSLSARLSKQSRNMFTSFKTVSSSKRTLLAKSVTITLYLLIGWSGHVKTWSHLNFTDLQAVIFSRGTGEGGGPTMIRTCNWLSSHHVIII